MAITVHRNDDFYFFATLTVDANGTAEAIGPISNDGATVLSVVVKDAWIEALHDNTDDVGIGPDSSVDLGAAGIVGKMLAAPAAGTTPDGFALSHVLQGERYDLSDWFVDSRVNDEGVLIIARK